MNSKLQTVLLLFIAGLLYLIAAPMYGAACHKSSGDMLAFTFGFPAMIFSVVGVVSLVGATVILIFQKD